MHFITWYESENALHIEDLLDESSMEYEFIETPNLIKEQDIMICKDCFRINESEKDLDLFISSYKLPKETQIFNKEGVLV